MIRRSIITITLFFTLPFFAHAAELFVTTVPSTVSAGDKITATLFLDTQGSTINALEGSLSFSQNLSLVQISHGDSLVTFWIRPPEGKGDTVSYAGIVPGGYAGDVSSAWVGYHPGKVLSVVFQATAPGAAWIEVNRDSSVLLHDGKATEAPLTLKDASFTVGGGTEGTPIEPAAPVWNDTTPPEHFTPFVIRNPNTIFSGKYYLIFDTSDKDSGVSYYEVQEGDGSFEKASSPYLLKDQTRSKQIVVHAVDRAGNVQTETIAPIVSVSWYRSWWAVAALLAVILMLLLVGIMKRRRRHDKSTDKN